MKKPIIKTSKQVQNLIKLGRKDGNFPIVKDKAGQEYKLAYGIHFNKRIPDYKIELHCAFRYKLTPKTGGLGPHVHFINFVKIMYPHLYQEENFFMEIYFKNMFDPNYKFFFSIGPGGYGKSTLAALFMLGMWVENPSKNAAIFCTTSLGSAKDRIWGVVSDLWGQNKSDFKSFSRKTKERIYYFSKELDEESERHCLVVRALPKTKGGADSVLKGIHPEEKLGLVIDEMDESEDVSDVIDNLQTGDTEFILIGTGNPSNRNSALGLACEPFGGYESIDAMSFTKIAQCTWDSVIKNGRVLFFPGYLNPRIIHTLKDPDREEYYNTRLARFKSMEEIFSAKNNPGLTHGKWMEQYIGFFPEKDSTGLIYLVDKTNVKKTDADKKATFSGNMKPYWVAGLDYGWTNGGDKTVLTLAKCGQFSNGKMGLDFLNGRYSFSFRVPKFNDIPHGWTEEDWTYNEVMPYLEKYKIKPCNFAIDGNNRGGALASKFFTRWSKDVHSVKTTGGASRRTVYVGQDTMAKELYDRKVTEMALFWQGLIYAHQVKGLWDTVINQAANRLVFEVGRNKRLSLESKTELKKRMRTIGKQGKSPDDLDSVLLATHVCHLQGLEIDLRETVDMDIFDFNFTPHYRTKLQKERDEEYAEKEFANLKTRFLLDDVDNYHYAGLEDIKSSEHDKNETFDPLALDPDSGLIY